MLHGEEAEQRDIDQGRSLMVVNEALARRLWAAQDPVGRTLMAEAVRRAGELWPGQPIRIGAQARLEKFYEGFGFRKASDEYIEDGIPHIEMLRP